MVVDDSGSHWEVTAKRVILPYTKSKTYLVMFLSTFGHVKSGGNLGGPSSKPKYYLLTDSAQVP